MPIEKKIIVRIKGGMGNQMFEYACARALQLTNPEYKLVLDISEIAGYGSSRKYALDCFQRLNTIPKIETNEYDKYSRVKNPALKVLQKISPQIIYRLYCGKNIFLWDEAAYRIIKITKNQDVFLNGYWQSSKYFIAHENAIREDYRFHNVLDKKSQELLDYIKDCESVCVHIRLGDYLNNPAYQVCDENYYKQGIDYINRNIKNACFFVFSDDIPRSRELLSSLDVNITFVEDQNSEKIDMQLMSSCKHFVISNSSFSWWAQHLSGNKDKIVVAPKMWLNNEDVKDIYESGWVLL